MVDPDPCGPQGSGTGPGAGAGGRRKARCLSPKVHINARVARENGLSIVNPEGSTEGASAPRNVCCTRHQLLTCEHVAISNLTTSTMKGTGGKIVETRKLVANEEN